MSLPLPRLVPNVELITINERTLLIVEVFPSNFRPHHLKTQGAEYGVYIRLGSSNRQADPTLINELRRRAAGIIFDEESMSDLAMQDIDLEAIINALIHSDYSQRGTPIRIAFFDDRIDIESPGMLLPSMTVEDMKSGVSKIRNPVIARVFRELELVEQWGSGVKRIFAEAKKQGLPEPSITEIATGVRFTVRLNEAVAIKGINRAFGEQVSEQVSEQVVAILENCVVHPKSRHELLAVAGLSNAYMNYKRHIGPLLEQGLLEMTIPDKPNSRLQQYRATKLGRNTVTVATKKREALV